MLVRAGELRSLALLQAASDSTVSNFSFVSPRGHFADQTMMLIRARFVLVVSGLKPVLRAGDGARGWLQS
jgi:hypothetical protein